MKLPLIFALIFVLSWVSLAFVAPVSADWWQRPTYRAILEPTRPLNNGNERFPSPTQKEKQQQPPETPVPTQVTPPVGGPPQATATPVPSKEENKGGGGEGGRGGGESSKKEEQKVEEVKGLSPTGDFGVADIMLLSGFLCLLLYLKSKLSVL